jgi:hypothetical protein
VRRDGQLKDSRSLTFHELRHQHPIAVWKFNRIMMTVRDMGVDRSEFSNAEIDRFTPGAAIVVFHVVVKGQFGSR